MAFGLKVMDSAGAVIFDSTLAVGWVALGTFKVTAGAGGFTNTYPALAGRTPALIAFTGDGSDLVNITLDVSLGYPRMTVTSWAGWDRYFMLVCS